MQNVWRIRKLVMAALVAVFLIQGWRVYTDETGRRHAALSVEARRGQEIWRRSNCQTCHQIFGMGGFLGADLTNTAARLSPENFAAILKNSPAPMPDFSFSDADTKALYSFLGEVNAAGIYPVQRKAKNKNNFIFLEVPWFSAQ